MLVPKPNAEKKAEFGGGWQVEDIRWKAVGAGYFIGVLVTLVVGVPLVVFAGSSWLLAAAGLGGLLVGGFVTGRMVGAQLALINGALMGILYYFTTMLTFFVGSFLQLLPEPLPGLPQGDSTFFFAWPLAQFVVSVLGAVLGIQGVAKGVKRGA